jgi:hypothetical protein
MVGYAQICPIKPEDSVNSEFIFTGDLPRQTISDRVQRGQL